MCYKITAECEVVRNDKQFKFTQHSYFQTEGAPGVYPSQAIGGGTSSSNSGGAASVAASDHFPAGGPLKDLTAYVKNTIPKVGQKPVYLAYDIGVIFNESYVDRMYQMEGMSLAIELYDNNDEPVLDTDGTPISIQNQWGDNPQTFLTREEEQWTRLLNSNDCVFLNYQHKRKTKNLYAGHKRRNLKPETLYKAKIVAVSSPPVNSKYDVYQISFITSKYSTFTHQVQSFHDVLWSHSRLLGSNAPLPLLTGAKKTILEGILSSVGVANPYQPDTEDKKFQQISELFGLGIRQLPVSFEMLALDGNVELETIKADDDVVAELMVARDEVDTAESVHTGGAAGKGGSGRKGGAAGKGGAGGGAIGSSSRCYGFLSESPEPIDWNRTDLDGEDRNRFENNKMYGKKAERGKIPKEAVERLSNKPPFTIPEAGPEARELAAAS